MALTTVLLAMSSNPSYLSTCPIPPSVSLEKSTAHGGKFWKGVVTPHALSIRFGRIGTAGQERIIENYPRNNPVQELLHRSLDKIREGYVLSAP
jgi:predicted DNA-binding WGR domain protein